MDHEGKQVLADDLLRVLGYYGAIKLDITWTGTGKRFSISENRPWAIPWEMPFPEQAIGAAADHVRRCMAEADNREIPKE